MAENTGDNSHDSPVNHNSNYKKPKKPPGNPRWQKKSNDSRVFDKINNMGQEQLIGALKYHNLDSSGSMEVLRKRLRSFTCKNMPGSVNESQTDNVEPLYSYLLIIDFEATCEQVNSPDYKHEIIEFPIVLYDLILKKTVDTFHAFCRPIVNPILSEFCLSLTKIDQSTIEKACTFSEVLLKVENWMQKHQLYPGRFAVACDCNADMAKFMRLQCDILGIDVPHWARQWINIAKIFRSFYHIPSDKKMNLATMLEHLGLEFEGQKHSGMTDATNILRIVETLLHDKCELRINEQLNLLLPPYFTSPVYRSDALHYAYSNSVSDLDCSTASYDSAMQ